MFCCGLIVLTLILFLILIDYVGGCMDELLAAVSRVQASINAANTKIDALKAGQADPVVLKTATDTLNAAADSLDAKVA